MADVIHSQLVGANLHLLGYKQNGDPLTIGAGIAWIDTSLGTGKWIIRLRNDANSGWEYPLGANLNTVVPLAIVAGDLIYGSAANTFSRLAKGTDGQVLKLTSGVPTWAASGGVSSVVTQVFAASGTYTPTPGMAYCIVECVGGGGGGGWVAVGSTGMGSGGGGGGYAKRTLTAALVGASKAVTVGAGGTTTTSAANDGGASSLGTLCVAGGGSKGQAGTGSVLLGGNGGIGTTGDVLASGENGGIGGTYNTGIGVGGCSIWGGGGQPALGRNDGNAGAGYGAGGSGAGNNATTAHAGGAGTAGYVVVTEYIA